MAWRRELCRFLNKPWRRWQQVHWRTRSQGSCLATAEHHAQTTTGVAPAELLMGRTLRSRLDLLRPDITRQVEDKQSYQKERHDIHASMRSFSEREEVYVRNFGQQTQRKWLPGYIVTLTGPLSHQVELQNGTVCHRHKDHVRKHYDSESYSNSYTATSLVASYTATSLVPSYTATSLELIYTAASL